MQKKIYKPMRMPYCLLHFDWFRTTLFSQIVITIMRRT